MIKNKYTKNQYTQTISFIFLVLIFSEPFMGMLKFFNFFENNLVNKIQLSDLILILLVIYIFLFEFKNKFTNISKIFNLNYKFFIFFFFIVSISSIINFNNPFNSIFKFFLLFLYYLSASYYLQIRSNIKKDLIIILKYMILLNIFCILFILLSFANIFDFNYLIKDYENFPLFNSFSRLIGPHKPTSKLFATYLFFSIIFLFLMKNEITKKFFWLSIITIFICSIFTFSRPGICSIFLILIYFFNIHNNKYLCTLIFMIFITFLLSIGIFHPEIIINNLDYLSINNTINDEYFGWYLEPTKFNFIISIDFYMNTYLILKIIALNSFNFLSIFIGNGTDNFSNLFISSSLNGVIADHYINSPFPYSQSTFITLAYEYGILASISYLLFILNHFSSKKMESAVILWIILFFTISIDLDIQHFRFIYVFLPIISYLIFSKNYNEK